MDSLNITNILNSERWYNTCTIVIDKDILQCLSLTAEGNVVYYGIKFSRGVHYEEEIMYIKIVGIGSL